MNRRSVVISTIAVTGAMALLAAIAGLFPGSSSRVYTDGKTIRYDVTSVIPRQVLWTPPEPVQLSIDPGQHDYEPRFNWDGTILFFVRGLPGHNADILSARSSPQGWMPPEPLLGVNGNDDELGPEPSRDGTSLYFYSNRPGGAGGYDIWFSCLEDGEWQEPVNLGEPVNTRFDEYSPAISPDSQFLYFSSNRPHGERSDLPGEDKWIATVREDFHNRTFDLYRTDLNSPNDVQSLSEINTPANEGTPCVSPEGDFLFFSTDRDGGPGGFDIWRARLMADHIGEVSPLALPINTPFNELDPALTALGHHLLFSSDRGYAGKTAAPVRDYDLFSSRTHEVFVESTPRESILGRIWNALRGVGWDLLLTLLVLSLILTVIFLWRNFERRELGLMARCALASLLFHLLLLFIFNSIRITSQVLATMGRNGPIRVALDNSFDSAGLATILMANTLEARLPVQPLSASVAPSPPMITVEPFEPADMQPDSVTRTTELEPAPLPLDAPAPLPVPTTSLTAIEVKPAAQVTLSVPHAVATVVQTPAPPHLSLHDSSNPAPNQVRAPAVALAPDAQAQSRVDLTPELSNPTAIALPSAPPEAHVVAVSNITTLATPIAVNPVQDDQFGRHESRVALPSRMPDSIAPEVEPAIELPDMAALNPPDRPGINPPAEPHIQSDVQLPPAAAAPTLLNLPPSSPDFQPLASASSTAVQRDPAIPTSSMPIPSADWQPQLPAIEGTAIQPVDAPPTLASAVALEGASSAPDGPLPIETRTSPQTVQLEPPPSNQHPSNLLPLSQSFTFKSAEGSPPTAPESSVALLELSHGSDVAISLPAETMPEPVPTRPTGRNTLVGGQENDQTRVRRLVGQVRDRDTDQPLSGSSVRLDLPGDDDVAVITDDEGHYELEVPEVPDFFAVTASISGYAPGTENVPARSPQGPALTIDFELEKLTQATSVVETTPDVHHLGNDRFEGRINSQFQMSSEGRTFRSEFELSADQLAARTQWIKMSMMTKGIQCPHEVRINGVLLDVRLDHSPDDGGFGPFAIAFDGALLREGTNVLEIRAVSCNGDLDDFEFVNVQFGLQFEP